MASINDKMQAAVYLVDKSLFEDYAFDETVDYVIHTVNIGLEPRSRYREEVVIEGNSDYRIRLYYNYKKRRPKWAPFLSSILEADAFLNSVQNTTYSFICFIGYQEHVFAITGGAGSLAIDRFVVQDFGMEIIMRLFQRQHKVVKSIQERGVTGIVLGQTRFYRGDQRFSDENDFGKIYKGVQAELSRKILSEGFGFKKDELKRQVSGCMAKASFQINKAVDFVTLLRLVTRFTEILKLEKNFALNKVNHLSKRRKNEEIIKQLDQKLISTLFENCINNIESDFDFCHQDFEKYRIASVFTLKIDSKAELEFDGPVDLSILIEKLKGEGRLLFEDQYQFKHSLLELTLEASDSGGDILTIGKVIDHIHGEITMDGQTYFTIDGEWYAIHPDFIGDINRECKDILEQCWECELVEEVFNLKKRESEFNCKFIGQPNTFVFDTVTPENIEACDVLKHNDQSVFLLHVKKGFNNSIRDLAAQISIAARRIKADKLTGYKYISELEGQATNGMFSKSPFMKKIGRQRFPAGGLKSIFEGKHDKNIVFCLTFVDTAKTTRCLKANLDLFDSNIAKYALIELRREIWGHGFDFKIIQLQRENV